MRGTQSARDHLRAQRAAVVSLLLLLLVASACSANDRNDIESISYSTSCADYLTHPAELRYGAVRQLGSQAGWTESGNPNAALSFDSFCGASPRSSVEDAIAHFMSGGASSSDAGTGSDSEFCTAYEEMTGFFVGFGEPDQAVRFSELADQAIATAPSDVEGTIEAWAEVRRQVVESATMDPDVLDSVNAAQDAMDEQVEGYCP